MCENGFNVLREPLGGTRLIEASAGTGKTYSIAILVLRILLEKGIPLEKILMVTFTFAAAGELEDRIRRFVRTAYNYATGGKERDERDNIWQVVHNAGGSAKEKADLLNQAVQSLDRLSAMTIHGFCQKTIDEFTFETNQAFDYEIVTDDSQLLNNAAYKFLREKMNILEKDDLLELKKDLDFKGMYMLLKKHLAGMKFIDLDQSQELKEFLSLWKEKYQALKEAVEDKFEQIKGLKMDGRMKLAKSRTSPEVFLDAFVEVCCTNGEFRDDFDFLWEPFGEEFAAINHRTDAMYLNFLETSAAEIEKVKQNRSFITYDDQIRTIHRALENPVLKEKLSNKYQAVFIDEFQDTDKYQYEIFYQIFSSDETGGPSNKIVFFIGDPKQSIYGWRGADLDTYQKAKSQTHGDTLVMGRNFRSSERMIKALNLFMDPVDYNLFDDETIHYEQVQAAAAGVQMMTDQGGEVVPITIWEFNANDERSSFRSVAREILRLLNEEVMIGDRRVRPDDIGVLVRENSEGDEIKELLDRCNIPAVKIDNKKVLDSEETNLIIYLLSAVISPRRGDINRVLLFPGLGHTLDSIKQINDEEHLEIFRELKMILADSGVYNMISAFLSIYGLRSLCMQKVTGQRVLTNINHLAELLHKVEKQYRYSPEELLVWIGRKTEGEAEEYEQRVESDEIAVQITTIHKAKGLEYPIVFAPGLCMIPKKKLQEKKKVNDFRKEGEYYFTFNFPGLSDDDKKLHTQQKEQENRRLIYVALTRAIYKSYISYIPKVYGRNRVRVESSFEAIYTQYPGNRTDLVEVVDLSAESIGELSDTYTPEEADTRIFAPRGIPDRKVENKFHIHSFSALSKPHHSVAFEKARLGEADQYDQFVFQDLSRGAHVGNALHGIFEYLEFDNDNSWNDSLEAASRYYPNIIEEKNLDLFGQMVRHVMKTEIQFNGERFRLEEIGAAQKIPEMDFYFAIDQVSKSVINDIMGEEADLSGPADLNGLMTGSIDLVFEKGGKYYILDWKSNYLGNSHKDYNDTCLSSAMKDSNYNLQYMIYTIALKRWLENRVENFDFEKMFGGVIYVFLRGVRENSDKGIFTSKPLTADIEKMDRALLSM